MTSADKLIRTGGASFSFPFAGSVEVGLIEDPNVGRLEWYSTAYVSLSAVKARIDRKEIRLEDLNCELIDRVSRLAPEILKGTIQNASSVAKCLKGVFMWARQLFFYLSFFLVLQVALTFPIRAEELSNSKFDNLVVCNDSFDCSFGVKDCFGVLVERRVNECRHRSANRYIISIFDFSKVEGVSVVRSSVYLKMGLINIDNFIDRNAEIVGFYNSFEGDLLDDFYLNDDLLIGDFKFNSHAVVESCSGKRTIMPFLGGLRFGAAAQEAAIELKRIVRSCKRDEA